jgi:hypothetical protein
VPGTTAPTIGGDHPLQDHLWRLEQDGSTCASAPSARIESAPSAATSAGVNHPGWRQLELLTRNDVDHSSPGTTRPAPTAVAG